MEKSLLQKKIRVTIGMRGAAGAACSARNHLINLIKRVLYYKDYTGLK